MKFEKGLGWERIGRKPPKLPETLSLALYRRVHNRHVTLHQQVNKPGRQGATQVSQDQSTRRETLTKALWAPWTNLQAHQMSAGST